MNTIVPARAPLRVTNRWVLSRVAGHFVAPAGGLLTRDDQKVSTL